jgi:hypothetical protein
VSWLVGAGEAILGFFSAIVNNAIKWIVVFGAYLAGKRSVRSKMNKEVGEMKDEQLKVASRPKLRRDALLERMRSRGRGG